MNTTSHSNGRRGTRRAIRTALAIALAWARVAAGEEPAAAGPTQLAEKAGPIARGQPMVPFGGATLDGRSFALSQWLRTERPNAIVISLFGTWCDRCAKGLAALGKAAQEHRAQRVTLVLIDVQEKDGAPDLGRWLVAHGIQAGTPGTTVVLDPFGKIAERLGSTALPRTFVVDASGAVRAVVVREGDDFEPVLAREVEAVLPGAPAQPPPKGDPTQAPPSEREATEVTTP